MKTGDKVKIISKSVGCKLCDSNIYNNGNGIGYIIRIDYVDTPSPIYVLSDKHPTEPWNKGGDFYLEKDIRPFDEFEITEQLDNLFDDLINTLQ